MTVLSAEGVASGYGSTEIVHDVDFSLGEREVICLLGRNGVGKSTLLKTILGLIRPKRGEVKVLGSTVTDWPAHRVARLGVGYGPQELAIFQELTVSQNLDLGNRGRRLDRGDLGEVLDFLPQLQSRLGQRAGSLSGGEQKMLVFARALLGNPRMIILDEVAEGVQPFMVERFREVIVDRNERAGTSFLIVEQNVQFALSLATRFMVMKGGNIVEEGGVTGAATSAIERHLVL